jgi:hypothetical protein
MCVTDLKTIIAPDGKRRVTIFCRNDAMYGFVEEVWYVDEYVDGVWLEVPDSLSLCETQEIAEREAYERVPWLRNMIDPQK